MPDQVHEVGAVFPVVDREVNIQPDLLGVDPQQSCPDAVERAGPGERIGGDGRIGPKHLGTDAFDPPGHFGCGTTRKRHQQDATGIGAIDDEVGDTMGERIRLARPGARDDQQRSRNRFARCGDAKFDGIALSIIQFFQIGRRHAEVPGKSLPFPPLAPSAETDCPALRAMPRLPHM
ncbi:hypothetical protein D3C87_1560840 [compost metagenome]